MTMQLPSYDQYEDNARLALDTLAMKPTKGVPHWLVHVMDIPLIEELAGVAHGDYYKNPTEVYLKMQWNAGASFIDQFIPENPLSMGQHGYESDRRRGATTGAGQIVLDDMHIDSPEAVVEHLEKHVFPRMEFCVAEHPEGLPNADINRLIKDECRVQDLFGKNMLKVPYGEYGRFPHLRYGQYGYENYFMAYALYPEVLERDFRLQADVAEVQNYARVQAFVRGNLPRVLRLDHDMASSRGTLVDIKSLDTLWFPHFARSIKPYVEAGIRLLWHCDGALMEMVPRLIEAGVSGFQGFQYEDGMDYEKICAMTDRNGGPLMIWAGCSVTRTLPMGTKQDVINELRFLVEKGPKVGLVLGGSSSVAPNTNHENVRTWIEGMKYYAEYGRRTA